MISSDAIKPISYLKTNASKVVRDVSENQKTLVITQNGEAKVIVQDIKVYEKNQESLAMLKILALSTKSLQEGKVKSLSEAFQNVRERIREHSER